MKKNIVIEGNNIHDIPSFYQEINRVLMKNEAWKIGNSLDAFNDLLYGGFGEIKQGEPVRLAWLNIGKSKAALGFKATKAFYMEKLANSAVFNSRLISERLTVLEKDNSPTFFEIITSITSEHPNIQLVEA